MLVLLIKKKMTSFFSPSLVKALSKHETPTPMSFPFWLLGLDT